MAAVYSVRLGAKQRPSKQPSAQLAMQEQLSVGERKPKRAVRSSVTFVGAKKGKSLVPTRRVKRVERELWQVFTYYTLSSDPLTPTTMRLSSFHTMLRECGLFLPGRLKRGEVDLAIAAQIKGTKGRPSGQGKMASTHLTKAKSQNRLIGRQTIDTGATNSTREGHAKRGNHNHLTFTDFLEVLRMLAPKVYPERQANAKGAVWGPK